MAVIQRGILGGFKNKIGNVVGGSWKGIATMRTLPLSVANPQTAGQVAQRTKFTAVVELAKFLLVGTIKPLWDRFAQKMSGYNAFVKVNIPFFDETGLLDYPQLIIGQGSLTPAVAFSGSASAASGDINFGWDDNSGSGSALGTDELFIVVYNLTQETWFQYPAAAVRSVAGVFITPDPAIVLADVLKCYACFRRADGTQVSNTSFFNIVVGA